MTTCLAFSFWNFFKNTWASSNRFLNRSKPTPKLLFTAFHRVPFTLFFPIFFEILPSSSNYNCLLPSSFPRNIQLLSTFSSNLFSNQSPFPRIIKKKKRKNLSNQKKEKNKSCRVLSSRPLPIFAELYLIAVAALIRRRFVSRRVRSFSMHAAGRVRQRGAGRRECDYCNFDEIRATWHERVCPW